MMLTSTFSAPRFLEKDKGRSRYHEPSLSIASSLNQRSNQVRWSFSEKILKSFGPIRMLDNGVVMILCIYLMDSSNT